MGRFGLLLVPVLVWSGMAQAADPRGSRGDASSVPLLARPPLDLSMPPPRMLPSEQARFNQLMTPPVLVEPFGSTNGTNGATGNNGNGNGNGQPREHISDNSFFIEEAYNQEPGIVQHIFNWVAFWDHDQGRTRNFDFLFTMELPIHSQDHQFSFTLPFLTFFEESEDGLFINEQGGFGDLLLTYRYQLFMDEGWQPAVAPRFSLILPTGDEGRDIGTGEVGYFFNLPVSKELDPFAFHFNAGFLYTPGVRTELDDGLLSPGRDLRAFNLGVSAIWLASYDLNFVLELFGLWSEELDDRGERDHESTVLINPGVRYAVFTSEDVQWVLGVSMPIGLSEDAPDYGLFLYMSVEHTFKKIPKNGNGH